MAVRKPNTTLFDYLGSLRHYMDTPVHGIRCGRQAEIIFAADLRRRARGHFGFEDEWRLVDARLKDSALAIAAAPHDRHVTEWRSAICFLEEEQRVHMHLFADMPSVLWMSACPCHDCAIVHFASMCLHAALNTPIDVCNPIIAAVLLFLL
jgi:hypothetical protein